MNLSADERTSPRRGLWVAAILALGFIVVTKLTTHPHTLPVYCEQDLKPTAETVVMLGASWCGYCARTRDFLSARKIAYCEYDIEHSTAGAARYRAAGGHGIPIIFIKNAKLFGYDPDAIDAALAANGVTPSVSTSPP